MLINVQCIALRRKFMIDASLLDIETRSGLLAGEIQYLSEEAREQHGFEWLSQLGPAELLEYRSVIEYEDDNLMRHNRWFKHPEDPSDMEMTDGWRSQK